MKNLHVLPTDKSSRLYSYKNNLFLTTESHLHVLSMKYQNIYITSDEEIKEGDYAYHKVFGIGKIVNINEEDCFVTLKTKPTDGSVTTPWKRNIPDIKKIILTTDQDLIGVQAIDDEFLEWFVKNPSCEYVEVSEDYFKPSNMVYGHDTEPYKIIIPKEEPKQYPKTFKELFANTGIKPTTDESGNIQYNFKATMKEEPKQETTLEEAQKQQFNYDNLHDAKEISSRIKVVKTIEEAVIGLAQLLKDDPEFFIQEPKQETFEEAAEWLNKKFNGKGVEIKVIDWNKNETNNYPPSKLLEEYAKWQQERSYSEEEIRQILIDVTLVNPKHLSMLRNGYGEFPDSYELTENGVDYIIEQFKKK